MSDLRLHLSDAEHRLIGREGREKPGRGADRIDGLVDQIIDLDAQLYVRTVMLESALELLERRAKEHARTLELVGVIVELDNRRIADLTTGRHLKAAA